jgi:hypothetical protein
MENWNSVSHNMSRLQIPKCKLKVTLWKYHTSLIFKKKASTSHYTDVGGDASRPKKPLIDESLLVAVKISMIIMYVPICSVDF